MREPAERLRIAALHDLSDADTAAVRAIYEEAFPARQREPFAGLRAADGGISLAGLEDGAPIGLAFFSPLSVGHLFLTYFAVAAGRRGAGTGGALWDATRAELGRRGALLPVVFEVEDPTEAGHDEAEVAQRAARVRFWERLGARMLPVDGYVVPNLDGSGRERLRLMRFGHDDAAGIDAAGVRALVVALYREGYALADDDPLVRWARELPGR